MTGTTNNKTSGFTLIEIMVAMSIFATVLLLVVGISGHTSFVQRRERGAQAIQEEIRFAIDLFNREARTGYGVTFVSTAVGNNPRVDFRNQTGNCVEYRWNKTNQTIERAEASMTNSTDPCETIATYTDFKALTSSRIKITQLIFTAHPGHFDTATQHMTDQGFITISLQAAAQASPSAVVSLQSTVTSRQLGPLP